MAKHYKFKKTLFFIEGHAATEAEIEEAMQFEPGVQFRCAKLHKQGASLETFDRLAGLIPDEYQAAQDAKDGKGKAEAPVEPQTPPAAPVDGQRPAVKPPAPKPGAGWSGNS